jgi:hypothetical protein
LCAGRFGHKKHSGREAGVAHNKKKHVARLELLEIKHIEERGAGGTCNKKSITHLELWTQKTKRKGGEGCKT